MIVTHRNLQKQRQEHQNGVLVTILHHTLKELNDGKCLKTFYINRQKMKKNGKCPIMGRITIDGKACQYSTGYEIDPCLWNPSTGRAFASGKILDVLTPEEKADIKRLNMQLDGLMAKGLCSYSLVYFVNICNFEYLCCIVGDIQLNSLKV